MVIVPDTDIILIESPLKLDNYNQITFDNATSQYNYFHGLPHLEYDGCTYQRKDGVIRYTTDKEVDANAPRFEDLLKYNYCMYKNDSYKDKWFYAFVTDCKYINDGLTEITIETDVFQTWQFDIIYKNSFIEREHVSNDTIGAHTIPEGLETGDYIIQDHLKNSELMSTGIVIGSTRTPGEYLSLFGGQYNGIFSGIKYYSYPSYTIAQLSELIKSLEDANAGSVTSLFMAPSVLIGTTSGGVITNTTQPIEIQDKFYPISSFSGYTPKNNKLLTYPYVAINVSNGQGSNSVFKQELFTLDNEGKIRFQIEGCLTPGCSIRCYPIYYKNTPLPYDEAIVLGKYPQLNWTTDTYTNWLTQNGVNNALDIGTGLLEVAAGVGAMSTGAGAPLGSGLAIKGASTIFNVMNENYKHSLIPPQAKGNINCGDVVTANLNNTFHYYKMSIKREFAEIIDRYFDLYGYKINTVKTPNIHKRSNWDFIKCIDVNLEGNIPEKDIAKIRDLFNNGCTFWHTTSYFLDYSRTNSIL